MAKDLFNHVVFEINQLFHHAEALGELSNVSYSSCSDLHIANLELFLLHSRVLIEFLSSDSKYSSSLKASDFIQSKIDVGDYLREEIHDIHKYVAHLSMERNNEKIWDVARIMKDISGAIRCFASALDCQIKRNQIIGIIDGATHQSLSSLDITSTISPG